MSDTDGDEIEPIIADVEVTLSGDDDDEEIVPEEDEEYEVETILNKRIRKGQVEYLVKWKGKDKEQDFFNEF